jgi:hypothetical protein
MQTGVEGTGIEGKFFSGGTGIEGGKVFFGEASAPPACPPKSWVSARSRPPNGPWPTPG